MKITVAPASPPSPPTYFDYALHASTVSNGTHYEVVPNADIQALRRVTRGRRKNLRMIEHGKAASHMDYGTDEQVEENDVVDDIDDSSGNDEMKYSWIGAQGFVVGCEDEGEYVKLGTGGIYHDIFYGDGWELNNEQVVGENDEGGDPKSDEDCDYDSQSRKDREYRQWFLDRDLGASHIERAKRWADSMMKVTIMAKDLAERGANSCPEPASSLV